MLLVLSRAGVLRISAAKQANAYPDLLRALLV